MTVGQPTQSFNYFFVAGDDGLVTETFNAYFVFYTFLFVHLAPCK